MGESITAGNSGCDNSAGSHVVPGSRKFRGFPRCRKTEQAWEGREREKPYTFFFRADLCPLKREGAREVRTGGPSKVFIMPCEK